MDGMMAPWVLEPAHYRTSGRPGAPGFPRQHAVRTEPANFFAFAPLQAGPVSVGLSPARDHNILCPGLSQGPRVWLRGSFASGGQSDGDRVVERGKPGRRESMRCGPLGEIGPLKRGA